DRRLRGVITTTEKNILSFIKTSDIYDPDRVNTDQERLRQFYNEHGYPDFTVVSAVADLDRERNEFVLTFTVEEGERYKYGNIAVESTIPDVDTAALRRLARTSPGDWYDSREVERSIEAMTVAVAEK